MPDLQDPELFRNVLDSLQTGVCMADRTGKILFWNQGAERLTGLKRHEVVGRSGRDNILPHCNDQGCIACGATCPFTRTMREGKPQEAKMQLRHKNGHPVHVLMRIAPIRNSHGSIIGIAESFDERSFASDRESHRNTLAAHGCMDETTGIPNHEFTRFHLSKNFSSFVRYHLPFGVLAIQVDRLEHLGAAYGRQAGDAVLRVVAQTMRTAFRPSDFLGRWTEDQFLAILINCGDRGVEQTAAHAFGRWSLAPAFAGGVTTSRLLLRSATRLLKLETPSSPSCIGRKPRYNKFRTNEPLPPQLAHQEARKTGRSDPLCLRLSESSLSSARSWLAT
jgi:PAS domain S-box-containing protein